MSGRRAFRVQVRHNVVCRLESIVAHPGVDIPESKLEVSTQLALTHRSRGCIDGDYYFADLHTAKHFAFLCQDFVKRVVDRTMEELEQIRSRPDQIWENPYVPALSGRESGTS